MLSYSGEQRARRLFHREIDEVPRENIIIAMTAITILGTPPWVKVTIFHLATQCELQRLGLEGNQVADGRQTPPTLREKSVENTLLSVSETSFECEPPHTHPIDIKSINNNKVLQIRIFLSLQCHENLF
jgi:hypothetical protein